MATSARSAGSTFTSKVKFVFAVLGIVTAITGFFGMLMYGDFVSMYVQDKQERYRETLKDARVRDRMKSITISQWIRDSEDYATAPILDASGGADGAALYFIGDNEAGYTLLRDVTQQPDSQIGYVYVDPKTKGVIVQIGNVRVGVK